MSPQPVPLAGLMRRLPGEVPTRPVRAPNLSLIVVVVIGDETVGGDPPLDRAFTVVLGVLVGEVIGSVVVLWTFGR